jgi:hypothetical protein
MPCCANHQTLESHSPPGRGGKSCFIPSISPRKPAPLVLGRDDNVVNGRVIENSLSENPSKFAIIQIDTGSSISHGETDGRKDQHPLQIDI